MDLQKASTSEYHILHAIAHDKSIIHILLHTLTRSVMIWLDEYLQLCVCVVGVIVVMLLLILLCISFSLSPRPFLGNRAPHGSAHVVHCSVIHAADFIKSFTKLHRSCTIEEPEAK